jgi:hypothetical protein
MTDQNYRDDISNTWVEKAEDAYAEAAVLFREKYLIGCVNRLYYSVFYAVSAAMAKEGKEYGKHSAVRASLHRDYVKTGRIPLDCGKTYDKLFEDRQQGDYTPSTSFEVKDIGLLLDGARAIIDAFKAIVIQP